MRLALAVRRLDWAMAASALLLTVLGVVLLATAGEATGARALAIRQGAFFVLAALLFLLAGKVHYSVVRSLAGPAYVVTLLLLIVTVVQAHAIRGAAAWIVLGSARIQPAEFMKVALVVVLARIVGGNRGRYLSWRRLIAALAAVALPAALILRQPDLGTVGLLVIVTLGVLGIAGLSRRQWAFVIGGGAFLSVLTWSFLLVGYQKDRVRVFLDPTLDPRGAGYTILQARTAFGSGGLTGRGLGWGPQSRLNFLPEVHTDFVFARIGEELGLVGVAGTLALFGLLFHRMVRAAGRTSDPFGRALAVGGCLTILTGLSVNAGMNVGLLPVTGIPLPFVSYGGSSLLAAYVILGLATSVVLHGERWKSADDEENVPFA